MEVKRLRSLGSYIFKALNKLNPAFIEEIFHRTKWVNVHNSGTILRKLCPNIWNSRSEHIKTETNFIKFKKYIKPLVWINLKI